MTEPTDAEIIALLGSRQFTTIGAVREALRRWGTPPAVAGGAECTCPAKDMPTGACCKVRSAFAEWHDDQNDGRLQPFDVFKGGWIACQRASGTPQPTQPQAGAVPLICEWAHNENDGFWESACGEAWWFDDGGPAENSMHFCHSCGKSLRIKGGQHGTE